MSKTTNTSRFNNERRNSKNNAGIPLAMIHKKILDQAKEKPEASMETIAESVNGATVGLVERVLEKYDDPGTEIENQNTNEQKQQVMADVSDESQRNEEQQLVDSQDLKTNLSFKQIEILEAICNNPDASQRELANSFNVSSATINRRLNSIEGFDWSNKVKFAKQLLDTSTYGNQNADCNSNNKDWKRGSQIPATEGGDPCECENEHQLRSLSSDSNSVLIHKLIRLCVLSDTISKEEELQIIEILINARGP